MRKDKRGALILRKSGRSYGEIKEVMGIPKSTLSDWLRESNWSNEIKLQLTEKTKEARTIKLRELNRIYRKNLKRIYQDACAEAKKEFEDLKFHPLFIAGISIYWGEGDRTTKHSVQISNTDPQMIKLFIKFLREVCGVFEEKIRAHLLLYPDLNPEECKKFWIKNSGLYEGNFNKSVIILGKHKIRRLPYGVCYINVSSSYLKQKIFTWLTLLPKEFIKNKYYKKNYYFAGVVQR